MKKRQRFFQTALELNWNAESHIFRSVPFYTHGIAVLTATGKLTFDRNNIEKMLKNLLSAFIKQEKPDWKFLLNDTFQLL